MFLFHSSGRDSVAVLVFALVAAITLLATEAERGYEKTYAPKVSAWGASRSLALQQEDLALRQEHERAARYRAAALRASRLAAELGGAELEGVPSYELPVWPEAYRSRPPPLMGSALAEISPWESTPLQVQAAKEAAAAASADEALKAKAEEDEKAAAVEKESSAKEAAAATMQRLSQEAAQQLNRTVQAVLVELHDSEARALHATKSVQQQQEQQHAGSDTGGDWKQIVESAITLRRSIEHRVQATAARAHRAEEAYGASCDVLQKGVENLESTIQRLRVNVPREHMAYVSDIKSAMHMGSKRSLMEMDAKANSLQRAVKTLDQESEIQTNEFEA